MWEEYREIAGRYPPITLEQERKLIAEAQYGSQESRDELVLRHLGFVMFRLSRKVFPPHLQRHGEDLFSAPLPILTGKVDTYNLRYRDANGNPKLVRFKSHIWKRIDGAIVDSLKALLRAEAAERAIAQAAALRQRRSGRVVALLAPTQERDNSHEYAEACCG